MTVNRHHRGGALGRRVHDPTGAGSSDSKLGDWIQSSSGPRPIVHLGVDPELESDHLQQVITLVHRRRSTSRPPLARTTAARLEWDDVWCVDPRDGLRR